MYLNSIRDGIMGFWIRAFFHANIWKKGTLANVKRNYHQFKVTSLALQPYMKLTCSFLGNWRNYNLAFQKAHLQIWCMTKSEKLSILQNWQKNLMLYSTLIWMPIFCQYHKMNYMCHNQWCSMLKKEYVFVLKNKHSEYHERARFF